MPRLPPDDPTIEEEAPQFDGTRTDQLDDTYRFRVAAASESHAGIIAFNDRGSATWKWNAELGLVSLDSDATVNELKALDNPHLSVDEKAQPQSERPSRAGYDPYATAPSNARKKPQS